MVKYNQLLSIIINKNNNTGFTLFFGAFCGYFDVIVFLWRFPTFFDVFPQPNWRDQKKMEVIGMILAQYEFNLTIISADFEVKYLKAVNLNIE